MASPEQEAAPFDPARWLAQARSGHSVALGLRHVDHGEDWCELALDYDRRLASDAASGVLASGPIMSLMDMAGALAVWQRRGGMLPQATLDLRLDYLRPARAGATIWGRARCYRLARRVGFIQGMAHDGSVDDPVAQCAGTFALLDAW